MNEFSAFESPPDHSGEEQLVGTVTMLVTDIVGSTALLRRLGDRAYADVLDDHCTEIRRSVRALGGYEIAFDGDGSIWSFTSARRAALAALDVCAAVRDRFACGSVRIRAGLHTGELLITKVSGLVGLALHEAVIIGNAAPVDTVWISELTYGILASSGAFDFGPRAVVDIPKLGPTPIRVLQGAAVDDVTPVPSLVAVS
jgi:class 3 adenylate cyclase